MADSKTPATTTDNGVAVKPADAFRAFMLQRAQESNARDRGREVMDAQLERIITAAEGPDDAALWDADMGGALQGRDIEGLWVRIHDLESVLSTRDDLDNTNGWYVQMNVTCIGGPAEVLTRNGLAIGASFVLQTGAELIAGKVRAWEARGQLPVDGVILGATTSSGNTVLRLGRVPEHVTVNAAAE